MASSSSRLRIFNIVISSYSLLKNHQAKIVFRLTYSKLILILAFGSFLASFVLILVFNERPQLEDSFIMIFTLLSTALIAVFGVISGWRQGLSKYLKKDRQFIKTIDEVVSHTVATSFMSIIGVAFAVLSKFFPRCNEDGTHLCFAIVGDISISLIISIFSYVLVLFIISINLLGSSYSQMTRIIDKKLLESNQSSSGNVIKLKK